MNPPILLERKFPKNRFTLSAALFAVICNAPTIQATDYTFTHPMTVTTPAELSVLKTRIAGHVEPQYSAYAALIQEANRCLLFQAEPPPSMNIMGGYEDDSNLDQMRTFLYEHGHAAYTCALAWTYSGDPVYAAKAEEILKKWTLAGTSFTGADAGRQLGLTFNPMLYAADLLRNDTTWPAQDREAFETWWRAQILPQVENIALNCTNNFRDAGILGLVTAGIAFEDGALIDVGFAQIMLMFEGRWKITKDQNGVYLYDEVGRSEGLRGLTYTAATLTAMVQYLEMARHMGCNFWACSTPQGATVPQLIKQYFAWDAGGTAFPWHSAPYKTDTRRNSYEVGRNHIGSWSVFTAWSADKRPFKGKEGDDWTTLNKGKLAPVDLGEPPASARSPAPWFTENFNDGNSDGWATTGGAWSIFSDGSFVLKQSSPAAPARAIYTQIAMTQDQSVKATIKILNFNGSNTRAGIFGRFRDGNNFYRLAIRHDPDQIEIKKTANGIGTTLASRPFSAIANTWYTLKFEIVGKTLKGYVDGDLILLAFDDTIESGYFGFDTGYLTAEFDNLSVR